MDQIINQYFAADHDRLDALFEYAEQLLQTDIDKAKVVFGTFARGLNLHILWEEQSLFPRFQAHSPMGAGPVNVMCTEHQQILQLVEQISSALAQQDSTCGALFNQLKSLLGDHNMKEEHVLYPHADMAMDAAQKTEMFVEMETMD